MDRIPVRGWIIAMIFFTSCMNSTLTSNISFIIESMVKHPEQKEVAFCVHQGTGEMWQNVTVSNHGPRYEWSKTVQWQIQVAYFYGVAIASLPAGVLAEWLGPKYTIFFPLLFAGVINTLSAFGAKWHWGVPLACRFIVGLATGTVYPALQCFVGQWAPPHEKGKFLSAIMGSGIGTAMVWIMIRYTAPKLGWPWTFYISSILIVIHCICFWFLTSSNPEDHKYISEKELMYIKKGQGGIISRRRVIPPYKAILTSPHCWALTTLNFGNMWGQNVQLQVVPEFIERFMGIEVHESVLLAILPHIARFCSGVVFGNISDVIRTKHLMSKTTMTKAYVVFSHLIPGFIMMSLGSIKCNAAAASILLILSNIFNGAAVGANLRNPTDLAPNFAGTIFGTNMCIGQMTGFIVPSLAQFILKTNNGIVGWTIVFLIGGGAYFGTGVIYIFFGSAETQPWNEKIIDQDEE